MTPAHHRAVAEGFLGVADRRKRLGQFFTGTALGRVLAALATAARANSIVDPMSGTGDLLAACIEVGAGPTTIGAIEIDAATRDACHVRLPEAKCLHGSAFDPDVIDQLPSSQWDLVITNPPYVRYQSMSKQAGSSSKLPGAVEVRTGLIAALKKMTALDAEDLRLFTALASGYSGLADLAVPSWILCASMVRIGGRIALVVPEAWLSRDYAAVIQYLLLRWFVIEHIVEDEHAVWFPDAQVKTTLIVAKRVVRRDSAFSWTDESYARTRISGKASSAMSPIARLYPKSKKPECALVADIAKSMRNGEILHSTLIDVVPTPIRTMARLFQLSASSHKWFSAVGESSVGHADDVALPQALTKWIGTECSGRFATLPDLGALIGQGLRTGANRFFYAEVVKSTKKLVWVASDALSQTALVRLPAQCAIPAVRKQSDLPKGFSIRAADLPGRVLDLRSFALSEDIADAGPIAAKVYTPMAEDLAQFVRGASRVNYGTEKVFRSIAELTAVAPNVRSALPSRGKPPRFWYMLPDFAPRHMPELIVARVNGGAPRVMLIADEGVIADANFSTISAPASGPDAYALLALLNSDWSRAFLESTAAVMGGGALKVEAAHLRRLPVPLFSSGSWETLSDLGKGLADTASHLAEINQIVASAALGRRAKTLDINRLSELAIEGRTRREQHR